MYPLPIDQLDATRSATSGRPALFHLLSQLEAMEIVFAVCACARNL